MESDGEIIVHARKMKNYLRGMLVKKKLQNSAGESLVNCAHQKRKLVTELMIMNKRNEHGPH